MNLIIWPAAVTLAITLLRLVGELQGWNPQLFNRAAGGGGALIGISWLPLLLGPFFAWSLAKEGKGPQSAWRVVSMALAGIVLTVATFAGMQAAGLQRVGFLVAFVVALAAAFIPWTAWPELGRTLLYYGLAARIPVALVMLVAIFGNWGTHYDVLPPNPPAELQAAGPFGRWFWIGFLPQMTIWIGFTSLVGSLLGGLVVALAKPKPGA